MYLFCRLQAGDWKWFPFKMARYEKNNACQNLQVLQVLQMCVFFPHFLMFAGKFYQKNESANFWTNHLVPSPKKKSTTVSTWFHRSFAQVFPHVSPQSTVKFVPLPVGGDTGLGGFCRFAGKCRVRTCLFRGHEIWHQPKQCTIIGWVVPPPSKSHHQDYCIFSRESL